MKKILIYHIHLLLLCIVAVITILTSCKKENLGVPVITAIKVTDPHKVDSTFTEGTRGQLIVIQGENLDRVLKIYFNDQPISFNPTLCTSTNLIVTIPSDLKLEIKGVQLEHQVKVETTHGTATFGFHVVPPIPAAYFYTSVDWASDQYGNEIVGPGQAVTILGNNFYEIQSIYMTSDTLTNPDKYDITEYSVNENFNSIDVKMPQTIIQRGFIVIKFFSGTIVLKFSYLHVLPPIISKISSDMPIQGETVTIWGKNFAEMSSILIAIDENTNITIPSQNITVNAGFNQLSFKFPSDAVITKGGQIAVVNIAGKATTDFYKVDNIAADFDNIGSWGWGLSGKNSTSFDVNESNGKSKATNHSGKFIGVDFDANVDLPDWLGMQTLGFAKPSAIANSTPIDSIELRFECYVGAPMDGVTFDLSLVDGANFNSALVDKNSNVAEVGRWITCSIPLSKFTNEKTFDKFAYTDWGWAKRGLYLEPKDMSATTHLICYFDNFRFYVRK